MATVTPKGAAPYRVRLIATSASGETVNIDQATIVAACISGPLRAYLKKIPDGDAAWFAIGEGQNPRVSYRTTRLTSGGTYGVLWHIPFNTVDIFPSAAASILLEIIYNQSSVR